MLKAKSTSPFSKLSWSMFKNPKVIGIVSLFFILIGLPIALYEVQQQQEIRQHAATQSYTNMDVCGNLVALGGSSGVTETPSCPGSVSNTTFDKYSTSVVVQNNGSSTINVTFTWEKYWCNYQSSAGQFCGGPDDPNHNGTTHTQKTQTVSLAHGAQVTLDSDINQAQQACGTFQNDLTFSYSWNGRSCGPGNPSTGRSFSTMNWGFCQTSNPTCIIPTTTPTNTPPPNSPTPTNTPAPSDTPIPSDTPSPTASPSATPTDTPAFTPTVTPTGTLTPTNSPTPTLTPPPGSSPTPTIIVVKPTLPPTGPGGTFVAVGLIGVAISVLGMALLLGF